MAKKAKRDVTPEPVKGIPKSEICELKIEELDLELNDLEFRIAPRMGDLVEDIGRNGQQFPIIVRRIARSKLYQIVSGYRRVRAVKKLGWPTVKAIVRDDLDDDAAYRVSFLENERRKSLTALDKAHAIAKLRLLGKTTAQIRDLYGIGERQFQRYEQVGTFPKALRDAIGEQKIQTSHGLLLAQAADRHGDKIDLSAWVERIVKQELTVRQLARALNREFRRAKKKVRYLERQGRGFRLYPMRFDPKNTDEAARVKMIETLKSAVEMLEQGSGTAGK